ncbi:MAG: aspartate aminotransferase family protein [Nitrospinota bacterium]
MTNPLSVQELRALDRAHVWHPLLQHRDLERRPLSVMVRAEGCSVWDAEGREYLDAMAGLWCVNIGYGRKEVADAAYAQMLKLPYYPLSQIHEPAVRLAAKLAELLPEGLDRFFFVNSGSEAVETALKMARAWGWQNGGRYKVIARYRAYHGLTLGATSATGQTLRRQAFEPLVPGFSHARPPYCYRCPWGHTASPRCCLQGVSEVEDIIRYQGPETVAAVIAEPIIGGGGVIPSPDGYLEGLREVCDRYGCLLILDEVITGFGRTGKLFACEHWGVVPDIMVLAKGIGSAYLPLAATAARESVFEVFCREGAPHFAQVSTYGGHPAACAAGLANLEILVGEGLVENAREVGEHLGRGLGQLRDFPLVGDVRGRGLIWGVELVEEDGAPLAAEETTRVVGLVRDRGVIVGKNSDTVAGVQNVLTVAPPLILNRQQADRIVDALAGALRAHQSARGRG